jgi:peptidoglycan/LPS O-acetylase OafA/YrhL
MKEHPHRIPSLDGLRAISIALVIISHLSGTRNFIVPQRVAGFFALGELGVRVFFVISGFLITGLLLRELEVNRTIHLRKFYFRRTFRIFPAYYVFIFVLIISQNLGLINLSSRDIFHTLTYTSNYYPDRSWYVGHTWSLSVEEQFYLLWPAVLLFFGKRRALWGALSLIVVCPMIRLALWHFLPSLEGIGQRFETVADSIAIGCVLAGARPRLNSCVAYRRILESRYFVIVPITVVLASSLGARPRINYLIGFTVMNLGIAACIDWCITNYQGRLGRVLNSRSTVFIGVMSYSIYLWQQVFLNRSSVSVISQFPLNLLLVGIASLASYYLIERPALGFRHRIEKKLFVRQPARRADLQPS